MQNQESRRWNQHRSMLLGQLLSAMLSLSVLVSVGCATKRVYVIPGPCPIPGLAAEMEMAEVGEQFPWLEEYLGRVENYCDGVDAARQSQ